MSSCPTRSSQPRWTWRITAAIAPLALAAGCSSGAGTNLGSAGEDGGATSDGSSVASPDAAKTCDQGCTGKMPAGAICVDAIEGQLVDPSGAPIAGEAVFVCGTNLCSLPVKTDAQGKARVFVCENMVAPAFKYLGGARYVSFGAAVTLPTQTLPPATLFPLPAQGAAFPAGGGAVSSGPVSLQIAVGSVKFDPSDGPDPNLQEFRAAAVDIAKAPPGIDPSLGIVALWGLAPVNATINPPAALTIPNPDMGKLAPGTKVDFFVNGLDALSSAPVPYGRWGRVGTGTVSADGATVTTDTGPGNGLPILSMVGVAPHR